MDTSILMAKFWGLFMVLFSLVFFFSQKSLDKLFEYVKDEKFLFILGLFSTFIGLTSTVLHSKWDNGWQLFISLLGWSALIKGVLRLTCTTMVSRAISSLSRSRTRGMLLIVFALGILLLYYAFIIKAEL